MTQYQNLVMNLKLKITRFWNWVQISIINTKRLLMMINRKD